MKFFRSVPVNVTRQNLLANYLGRGWSLVANFLFVPVYIAILGTENYGLIAFHTTLALIVSVLDIGLSSAFARVIAREGICRSVKAKLKALEITLFYVSLFIAMAVFLASTYISENWLNVEELPISSVVLAIKLMGLTSAFQLLAPLYIGGFMGLEMQVRANALQFLITFSRSALVIPAIYWFPQVEIFFCWAALSTFVTVYVVRLLFWKLFSECGPAKFSYFHIRELGGFALAMGAIGLLSAVNSQLDKLLVSTIFSLGAFAKYSIASLLASMPLILTTPISATVLPKIARSAKLGTSVKDLYTTYSMCVGALAVVISTIVIVFPEEILHLWTQDDNLSIGQAQLVRLLVLANLSLALQLMPFQLGIAFGYLRLNIMLSLLSIVLCYPGIYLMSEMFGIIGVAIPWVVFNIVAALVLSYVMYQKFIGSTVLKPLMIVLMPLGFSVVLVAALF